MLGVVEGSSPGDADYLFRVSLKALIQNDRGEVLVVKERGRDWWDLPGGGMNYGDTIYDALARELKEEVGFEGPLTLRILHVENPRIVRRLPAQQVRLIFLAYPGNYNFSVSDDADEMAWKDPRVFEMSRNFAEQQIWRLSLEKMQYETKRQGGTC